MKISLAAGASDLPWSGITFGLAISSIWYWCSDQVSRPPKRIFPLYMNSITRFSTSGFFHESVSPKSTGAPRYTTGVVDTGGKFDTGVVDTGGAP